MFRGGLTVPTRGLSLNSISKFWSAFSGNNGFDRRAFSKHSTVMSESRQSGQNMLNKIWKDNDITIITKCRIVNMLVFLVKNIGRHDKQIE